MQHLAYRRLFALGFLALLLTSACGGGGHSPTAPPTPVPTGNGSASITGEVNGGSANTVATAAGELRGVAAADGSGAGYTVRVNGTNLVTTTDAGGRFALDGVPSGNQMLVFESSSSSAALILDGIQEQEQIDLVVHVQGSTATIETIQRSSDTSGDDEEGPSLDVDDLELEIAPEEWNLNFSNSSGTVAAFLRGEGIDEIDLGSIEMAGDDPAASPLAATRAELRGDHVRAEFPKNAVIDLLLDPQPGSVHTIEVSFTAKDSEERLSLTFDIVIEDDEDDGNDDGNDDGGNDGEDPGGELGNLSLQVSPDTWNLNYDKASGSVTAFIRGDGLDQIDLASVQMVGDNEEAAPLPASTARLEGNHVRAQFPKNQVLDLLDEPKRGSTHEIAIEFLDLDGEDHELTAEIRVVGNG